MCAGKIAGMFDVAVVGGGPAGSAAARLLASWNHRVLLFHRERTDRARAESIPPSCRKLFAACGMAEAIDAGGFYRSTGNTVWWGSDEPRCEPFADSGRGYQVERSRFDEVVRREAVSAGVELRDGRVRQVEARLDGAVVLTDDPSRSGLRARFVLDCSGRAGVIARHGWRTEIAAHPRTVAITAVWARAGGWPSVDPTHTLVESYEDGWAWSVPVSREVRHVTAMIDPQRTRLARGAPAADVYASELRKARHLDALTRDAALRAGPWGSDASVYTAQVFASGPLLLVGDAASFIDPLSSYGIKKALASAWSAAVAVHTALRTSAMAGAALAFHAAREEAMAASLLRQQRVQFADGAAAHAHAFWSDRAELDLPGSPEPDARALREDARVQRAFASIRERQALRLRPGVTVRREPHPVVRGHELVMEERLASDAWAQGIRFIRDVDLVGVLDLVPAHSQVPAAFEAYNRRFPPVALPDFLGVLSVMLAYGFLEHAEHQE
jgi:flavin-dependent dehydrogenase